MKKQLNVSAREQNDHIAAENRRRFSEGGLFVSNIIGSPGCGKTAILEYTARHFREAFAVLVGDVKTALDSDRIIRSGQVDAFAIETGGGCHLSAQMIRDHLKKLRSNSPGFLFIENVGNLVCPSSFDLGEHIKVAVLSIPEGDEKVRKYPSLFLRAGAVLINKVDLLGIMDYDIERVRADCLAHNPEVRIFEISAKTGQGFEDWFAFLRTRRRETFP